MREQGVPAKTGIVVAIDGPAGVGKSTLARSLARRLLLPYVNTGMMYRALTQLALERGISPDDTASLTASASSIDFSLGAGSPPELLIQGRPPPASLSSREVEDSVSAVAAHQEVRTIMRRRQRALGAGGSVMEGRDIGTRVFPDAEVKIFLAASPGIRGERRSRQRGGDRLAPAGVRMRDELDSRTTPFEPAPDAAVIDTTLRSPSEVLETSIRIVSRRLGDR